MENDRPGACESCHYPTGALMPYDDRIAGLRGRAERLWLCDLCAGTHAGNAAHWPEQYQESGKVMQTVCYVGNVILEAIRAKKEGS